MFFGILYLYLIIICLIGLLIIFCKNTIQSLFFFIIFLLLISFLFIFFKAEFIALIIILIYIGAISVLFLFAVMLLNLRLEDTTLFYNLIYLFVLIVLIILGIEFLIIMKFSVSF